MATVETWIDGVDVTQYVIGGQVTHRLNRPTVCQVQFPSSLVDIDAKSRIKINLNGQIDFHGTVEGDSALEIDGDADPDSIITTAQAIDPLVYLDTRRAQDADGDYSNPTFMYDFQSGPQILHQILLNTTYAIGSLPFLLGTFATGGADISGAPTNWPMMISEVMILLTDTGECDIEMVPLDFGYSSTLGMLNAYNGNMGNDLSSSVHLEYQTGSYNCRQCRMTVDKSGLANNIRYLLGPRRKTAKDPGALQHWDGSLEPSGVNFPAGWYTNGEPARQQSEIDYGIRQDTVIIDAQGDSNVTLPRELYRYRWAVESYIRLKPKVMVHLTPEPGVLPTFRAGDLITVSAGSAFQGGFSGVQRVMEYTYHWDENGVVELGSPEGQAGAAAVTTTAAAEGLI